MFPFYNTWVFSGGIKWKLWLEMGSSSVSVAQFRHVCPDPDLRREG